MFAIFFSAVCNWRDRQTRSCRHCVTCFVFVLCFVVVQVCVCVADLLDDVVDLVFVSQMTCSLAVISALAAN